MGFSPGQFSDCRGIFKVGILIISHKHRFIFIRPKKVASSSIEFALRQILGPRDVATSLRLYRPTGPLQLPSVGYISGCPPHATAYHIKRWFPQAWKSYHKFTLVRNPWDVCVSLYFWFLSKDTGKPGTQKSPKALRSICLKYSNLPYTFLSGLPYADTYIRFDNLTEDLKSLSTRLGVDLPDLIHDKAGRRKQHRQDWFRSPREIERVYNLNLPIIEKFNFQF